MIPIKQPTDRTCGQTCVAMFAGVSVDEAIRVCGTRGGTHSRHLRRGLRALGIACADRAVRPQHFDGLCLAAVVKLRRAGSRWGHYIVWWNGLYYDPGHGRSYTPEELAELLELHTGRIVSILPVIPRQITTQLRAP